MSIPDYIGFLLLLRLRLPHIDQDPGRPTRSVATIEAAHPGLLGPGCGSVAYLVKGVVSNGAFKGLHETMSLRSTNRPSSPI